MLNAFKMQDKEHFVSYVQVLKKKRFCSCRLIQIECKAQRLALWVASYSVCILNSSISMFYIYGREGTRTCLECVFACHGYNREKSWTVGKDRYV